MRNQALTQKSTTSSAGQVERAARIIISFTRMKLTVTMRGYNNSLRKSYSFELQYLLPRLVINYIRIEKRVDVLIEKNHRVKVFEQ